MMELDPRFETLLKLIARINSKSTIDELLGSIMESAKKITNSEASSLMMADKSTDELIVALPTGPAQAEISGVRIPAGKGVSGWVFSNNEPVVVNDPKQDDRFLGDISKSSFVTRNLVCVPLRNSKGEVIGVLQSINSLKASSFDQTDLQLLQALADQAALSIEKEQLYAKELEAQRVTEQLQTARNIQQQLLPNVFPVLEGCSIYGESVAALHVGGDYYDFFEFEDGTVGFTVADVVGKGVPAALLMATIRAILKTLAFTRLPIDELITKVNSALKADLNSGQFVTLFYAELDCKSQKLSYVNAGHNPPYLKIGDGECVTLDAGGPILGILEGIPFMKGEVEFPKDSFLFLFSDGVTESQNDEGDQYDEERVIEFIHKNKKMAPKDFCKAINDDVDAFTGEKEQDDDRTMIALSSYTF